MNTQANGMSRIQKANNSQGQGPNWLLIGAGALLSTLSIRLGYKLMQTFDSKRPDNTPNFQKGNSKSFSSRRSADCCLQSTGYSLKQDDHGYISCISGMEGTVELKYPPNGHLFGESDGVLPLMTLPNTESHKDTGVIWASSPDRLELPSKPFYHSNCSDSPCVSESGSDIFSKREVIQKLRQQLKRRDDMILEMQDQLSEFQCSLRAQLELSSHLQSQLDAANRDLFESEREIQRLRKVIADHCVGHVKGHLDGESPEKARDNKEERIDMLRRQVVELKEVIEGKECLLQSYKEQKKALSMMVGELQLRLESQLPHIL